MKLHLPLSLLAAVVAVFAAQPACAYDIPDQYANAGIEIFAPQDLDDYRSLNSSESYMFQFYASATFNAQTNQNWYPGNSLMYNGYCLFTTADGATPVSLSFDGTDRYKDNYLQNPVFSTHSLLFANLNKLQIENAGEVNNSDDDDQWNYYSSYDNAISTGDFSVTEVNDVVFKNNASSYTYNVAPDNWEYNTPDTSISCYADGGAVGAETVSLCQNGDITFEGNKLHFDNSRDTENVYTRCDVELRGGAISTYTHSSNGVILISDNSGKVSFTGNSVELIQGATCELSYLGAYGGAVHTYGTLKLNNNAGGVAFTGNKASASAQSVENLNVQGGAVYAENGISINGNADVTFSGNKASASAQSVESLNVQGGAVYTQNNLSICNNASVNFADNAIEASMSGHYESRLYTKGGAIYSNPYNSLVDISNNGDVSFTGNSIRVNVVNYSSFECEGAAIYAGGDLRINNNASVEFSDNYAEIDYGDGYYSTEGSAIYAGGTLEIAGNESVEFRNNGSYAIRQGYGTMKLSAKTGGHITF